MRSSLKIGAIGGVPIRVHWSFSLLVVLVFVSSANGSTAEVLATAGFVLALFACVVVHELSHCAIAKKNGLRVKDITLLPIGGVSQIEGLGSTTPQIERDVAIAGPLASIGLAVAFGGIALLAGGHLLPPTLFGGAWLSRLAWMNLLLAGFNLLPALPMDGGRVLRAVLAKRGGNLRATKIASSVAVALGIAMVLVGIGYDLWLMLIGAMVIAGAMAERRSATVQESFSGIRIGDVMSQDPTSVLAQVTVAQLAPWLQSFPGRAVPIVDGERYVGIVAMEDLVPVPPWTPVGDAADRLAPVLDASQDLYPAALEAFGSSGRQQLTVMSGGRVVGVIYRLTLQAVLTRQTATSGRSNWSRAA
jgi:Zn-dependent protease